MSARKALQREALRRRLDAALRAVYHNATLGRIPLVPQPWEDEEWDELSFYYSSVIEDLKRGYILGFEDFCGKYGDVFTYGRGGRTCAPCSWIRCRGGSSFSVRDAEDIIGSVEPSFGVLAALVQDVEAWNAFVGASCAASNIEAVLEGWIAGKWEEKKQAGRAEARLRLM